MIPGLCRVWARRTSGNDQYWHRLPQHGRGFRECQDLVDYYEEHWGSHYIYEITADHDLCRPAN